jgi:hypothetical protein
MVEPVPRSNHKSCKRCDFNLNFPEGSIEDETRLTGSTRGRIGWLIGWRIGWRL